MTRTNWRLMLLGSVAAAAMLTGAARAQTVPSGSTPVTFFGEDVNPTGSGILSSTPQSNQARDKFFLNLKGVGTETFESIPAGTSDPVITFPGVGTATLTGGGSVESGPSSSNQYPISGSKYYNAGSSSFVITFAKPIAAFGFYGTDIGDFGGKITLTLSQAGGGSTFLTVPNVVDPKTANGSALYYGFYDTHIQYTQITFGNTGSGDFFGFDDFSVGAVDQVVPVSTIATTGGDIAANVYSLGSAAARANPVVFDGGVLRLTGGSFAGNIITAPVTIEATNGTVDTSTGSGGFSGVVSGPGALTITGGKTFILTGANTYAGGTILKEGTLAIGSGAALGTGALTLDNGTTLQFVAGNVTLANAVALPNVDPTIDTGSNTVTMSGSITGPGALTKVGSGTLDLTGTSPYTGDTIVAQGTLLVDGSIAASAVTVQNGAAIGGGGTIGALTLQNGATLGHSASRTLTVIGNVTFSSGASYQVTINGDGTGSRLNVGGKATLGGSTLTVLAGSGTFGGSTYTLISAAGGVAGTFGTVATASGLALFAPTVTYGTTAVTLTLRPVDFATLGTTPNQRATATAIQALGQGSTLYTGVASQSTPGGAQQAFASASGTSHADPGNIILTTDRLVTTVVLDRLWDIGGNGLSARETLDQFAPDRLPALVRCYGPMPEVVPAATPRRYTAWGEGFGSFGHNDGTANAGTLDRSLGGFVLGIDTPIDNVLGTSWRMGVAGGYTSTAYRSSIDDGSGTVQGAFGTLYGGARYGAVDVRAGATVGGVFTDARRTVAFPGFNEPEASHNTGITGQAFGEIGYRFTKADMVLEPIFGASVLHVHQDGFTEKGGAAALTVAGQDNDFGTTTLGFRGETTPFRDLPLTAHGLLAWQHTVGDVTPSTVLAFAANPSQSFSVTGTPIDRDALAAEAALDYKASLALDIGLSYSGVIGPTARDHSVKGRFEYRF